MLVHGQWVLPIDAPPVRDGAVLVRDDLIGDVGPLETLARVYPDEPIERHDDCVVLPGLVNAHTHLELTVLGGLLPSAPFGVWLPLLVRAMRTLTPESRAASVARGARQCLEAGVTLVGEIAYGAISHDLASAAGLGGVYFTEVLGIEPAELDSAIAAAGYPAGCGASPRCRAGISPHSPYTSGPDLLRAAHRRARADGVPYAIHVAESHAEAELFEQGGGPLAGTAARFARGLRPGAGTTPVGYLDELGVLDGSIAVHCVQVSHEDVARIASACSGVVLCPRSNAYLHEGPAPIADLERAGTPLALGTDSSASNDDLDLVAEARAIHRLTPHLPAERIVRMMTADGAAVLGMERSFGSLTAGKQADLAAFRCADAAGDPFEAVLAAGGRATLVGVMSAGAWRTGEGVGLGALDTHAERLLDEARAAARAALR